MEKKPRIYVAGPMRGYPKFNYPKFNDYTESLRSVGWDVVNPVEISAGYGTPEQINADPALLAAVTEVELDTIKTCDAIYLLDGWQNSEGARMELATAIAYGLKIYLAPVVYIPLIRCES